MADKKEDFGVLALLGAIGGIIGLAILGKKPDGNGEGGHSCGCGK